MLSLFNWIYRFFTRAVDFFSGIPTKIALLVGGISAVVSECVAFSHSISDFFASVFQSLDSLFSQFASMVSESQIFSFLSYCVALDTLAGIISDVCSFVFLVLGFLFMSLLHAVFIFLGFRFGYKCYQLLLRSLSNGFAHG